MPALMPALVATSVNVSPCSSRTRRATAPSWRPTSGGSATNGGFVVICFAGAERVRVRVIRKDLG